MTRLADASALSRHRRKRTTDRFICRDGPSGLTPVKRLSYIARMFDLHMDAEAEKMRNGFSIYGAMVGLMISISAVQASDVWVQQAHGNMPVGPELNKPVKTNRGDMPVGTLPELNKPVNTTPEATNATPTPVAGSPTAPVTCNQANASSPACYSATQQAKGK